MRIAVGSDHGGFTLKEALKAVLAARKIDVEDVGCHSGDSVDYPDYAEQVARRVSTKKADEGLLVCRTGIGMSIAANRFPGVRAALCISPEAARMARTHNNANVLVMGGDVVSGPQAEAILDEWLRSRFTDEGRHKRRVGKILALDRQARDLRELDEEDPETAEAIRRELDRQRTCLNLIASENYASAAVRAAQGSVMTNKYAEGYPGRRWYDGCENVDEAERLAIERVGKLFGAEHANVQPHCGSSANMAVYFAELEPGDTILAMNLSHGGHLTHGHKINFSGRFFHVVSYGVSRKTGRIDYDEVAKLAGESRPKLIVAGASSYPRILAFDRFREIADGVGARLMVDMAHIAGLVAGGCHPSPVPYAEFVTSTTHKTLRGPRSGLILCRREFAEGIDREVFPGIQGGPQMHAIAAKAVCFHEALRPGFKTYAEQIVRNARALAEALRAAGFRLVSDGTDNHLMLVDVSARGLTGRDAAAALSRAGIIVNKNVMPFDKKSAFLTSGIRIGTPAVTTRGMKERDMAVIAEHIAAVLAAPSDAAVLSRTRSRVRDFAGSFPVP